MELIGNLAAILTIAAFLPQAYKAVRTGKTRDLSLPTYVVLVIVSILWTIYGIGISSTQITVTNSIVGAIALFICVLKLVKG